MNCMKTVLSLENVEKYYGRAGNITKAINNISFNVYEGDFLGIMGPSGSGKTTLLNIISTIDKPSSGLISVDGTDITKMKGANLAKFRREKLGFVFQDFNLLDTLTIYENIALTLSISNIDHKEIDKKIKEVTKLLRIEDILNKYPYEVSGGQKQRAAVARAIIGKPSIIMADEPTGALDSKSANNLLKEFENLNKTQNSSILMVTHDSYAASFCKRVIFINDGRIFTTIEKGDLSNKEFYEKILDVLSTYGGGNFDSKTSN